MKLVFRKSELWLYGVALRIKPFANHINQLWHKQTKRERRLLGWLMFLVMLVLVWLVGVRPALKTIVMTQQQLPLITQQSVELDAIIREFQALGTNRPAVLSVAQADELISTFLRHSGIVQYSAVQQADTVPASWRISFNQASASALMTWLADISGTAQLHIKKLDLERTVFQGLEMPGQLSGTVELVLSEVANAPVH